MQVSPSSFITNPLSGKAGTTDLGQDQFLQLLIAQLRNQDPLNPMEDREFITQIAQFNTLEQMHQLNDAMDRLNHQTLVTQALALVGRNVEAKTADGEPIQGLVTAVGFRDGHPTLTIDGETDVRMSSVVKVVV